MDSRFAFVCRVCLVDSSSIMRSLADEETREILFECTSVWVAPDDQLPQKMCAKCWNQCKSWSDFKALAQDSERQLGLVIKKEVEDEVMDEGDPLEYLDECISTPENDRGELAVPSFCDVGNLQKKERNPSAKGGSSSSPIKQTSSKSSDDLSTLQESVIHGTSKKRYIKVLCEFKTWMKLGKLTEITEDAVLLFLTQKSTSVLPVGLYSVFSMLKATLPDQNMDQYLQVKEFLKKISKGYKPKKGPTFTDEQINTFIATADQTTHLLNMVIAILGYAGAMRRKEIFDLKEKEVTDQGEYIEVSLKDSRTHADKKFIVVNKEIKFADILRSYMAIRPEEWEDKRFLFGYNRGKVLRSPVGINRVGDVPITIAKFLDLPDPESYHGYVFKRSCTVKKRPRGRPVMERDVD